MTTPERPNPEPAGAAANADTERDSSVTARPSRWRRLWLEWLKPIAVLLLVVCSFRSAIADWNDVPTGSMKPTILEGDRILVNKAAYDLRVPFTSVRLLTWGAPERGEVIVLDSPADGRRLVKRVVGLPGDRIALQNDRLFIDGEPVAYGPIDAELYGALDEEHRLAAAFGSEMLGEREHPLQWTPTRRGRDFPPFTVPEGHYFVMGDNRHDSFDSRNFGVVSRDEIFGRAVAVVLSLDPERLYLPRWWRFCYPLR